MKKLFLPLLAMSFFAACSSDSSSSAASEVPIESSSSEIIIPGEDLSSADTGLSSSTDLSTSSSSATPIDPEAKYDTTKYNYYGAELSGTDQFKYGRFEARMKMVSIPGSVSSMFLYYDNSYMFEDEPWNEIDIEVLGKNDTSWQSNIITREADPTIKKKTTTEGKHPFGFHATEDFHLYAMIWTPEYVSWEIDSVEIRRISLGEIKGTYADSDQVAFLTETQTLRFNLWASASGAWVDKFTGAELANGPKEQLIDYVRVYKYNEASKDFSLDWIDNFDGASFSDHWSFGNWAMERVELSPNNVLLRDGYCVMQLSREDKI